MGRHHHLRFPEHLYLSPPTPPQPSSFFPATASSFFAATKPAVYILPFQETGRSTVLADTAFAVGDRIPGFKTSAAFFNTLRANLILDPDSSPPSLANTPVLRPTMASSGTLPPPSPSPLAHSEEVGAGEDDTVVVTTPENPLESIPELSTKPAVSVDDKVDALHLLADSVAQQRQVASNFVIFHPLSIGTFILFFGMIYQYMYKGQRSDWFLIGSTSAGVLMSMLVTVRWLAGGYIDEAEKVGTWKWLDQGRDAENSPAVGEADEVLLSRFGDEVIGTVILRGERDTGASKKPRRNAPTTGVIRGWTVKRRYRGKGVGQGLLEDATKLCQNKGWSGPEFAEDHAHSKRILPSTFNSGFSKRDRKAHEMLEKVRDDMAPSTKKGKR
ncbi:hypothetical protein EDD36DRAFT_307290 [Exophiala viscosa]|uniref:N-acetyltransferase domain-containing protein n=1 Tax=Exophiala viscosa TaxID=2486360 RepID=A0AAN6DQQ7_9EURO|nr:hypothetical protein EDD36DRAFT_307290 [Exophiala viscosa]